MVSLLFLLGFKLFAASPKTELKDEAPKDPIVSLSGQIRMTEQLDKLRTNVHQMEANIDSCDKNVETLQKEINTLDNLSRDHHDLIRQYEGYLSLAAEEKKKNIAGLAEIEKWEKQFRKAPKETQAAMALKLQSAKVEKIDRLRWDSDADKKMASMESMKKGIVATLKEVEDKKVRLRDQMNVWKEKKAKFKGDLEGLEGKKQQLERLLAKVQEKYKERFPASP